MNPKTNNQEPLQVAKDALQRIALNISGDTAAQVIAGEAMDAITALQASATNNEPLGGDEELPISMSTYGSLEECEKERARRAASQQAGAAGASDIPRDEHGKPLFVYMGKPCRSAAEVMEHVEAARISGAAGASEVKPWQERCDITRKPEGQVERAMAAEIADLRAQLERQRQGSGEPVHKSECERCEDGFIYNTEHTQRMACPECATPAPQAQGEPVGEVRLGAHGKLIDWYSSDKDLFALPVGTKLYLGPAPQADEVRNALVQALQDITNPIGAMKRDVPEGCVLNPHMAVQMADDPQWYKRRAQQALDALRTTAADNQKGGEA